MKMRMCLFQYLILSAIGLQVVSLSSPTFAATEEPVVVKISLRGPEILHGQPLVVDYDIANIAPISLGLDLGRTGNDIWQKLELFDEHGQSVARAHLPKSAYQGATVGFVLQPGHARKGSIVISKWLKPPASGRFVLNVHTLVRYSNEETVDRAWFEVSEQHKVPLMISPTVAVEPQRQADKLRETILTKDIGVDVYRLALDQLFSMPDEIVFRVWRSLVFDKRLSKGFVMGDTIIKLRELGSPRAVELLASIWEVHSSNGAKGALMELYRTANPSLKPHIKQVFIRMNGRLPDALRHSSKKEHVEDP